MKTIWKYDLKTTDTQNIEMPVDAKILCVQMQYGEPKLWCIVNPQNQKAFRQIRIIGTGHEFEDDFTAKYISTYQLCNGGLIFHVFDEGYE